MDWLLTPTDFASHLLGDTALMPGFISRWNRGSHHFPTQPTGNCSCRFYNIYIYIDRLCWLLVGFIFICGDPITHDRTCFIKFHSISNSISLNVCVDRNWVLIYLCVCVFCVWLYPCFDIIDLLNVSPVLLIRQTERCCLYMPLREELWPSGVNHHSRHVLSRG